MTAPIPSKGRMAAARLSPSTLGRRHKSASYVSRALSGGPRSSAGGSTSAHRPSSRTSTALAKALDNVRRSHREAEHSLRRAQLAQDRAEKASQAKSQFLANISHELRTPLHAFSGFTSLLRETPLDEEQISFVERMEAALKHLTRLLDDLLDLARIDVGTTTIQTGPFNLHELLHTVEGLYRPQSERNGVTFEAVYSTDLPSRVIGDSGRLQQVLINLLSNAIKFTPAGYVRLRADCLHRGQGRAAVRFQVQDTGIGIPREMQEAVFQPFVQADVSHTRRYGGAGLGLTLAKRLTELMGGGIDVESEVGVGTTFSVTLPFDLDVSFQSDGSATVTQEAEVSSVPEVRALIVEDDETNAYLLRHILHRLGIQVRLARNGNEAIEFQRRDPCGLIFMDCQMPVMDGYEATRRIRQLPWDQTPIIIALTACVMPEDRDRCFAAGVDDFLPKPFTYKDIVQLLRKWAQAGLTVSNFEDQDNMWPRERIQEAILRLLGERGPGKSACPSEVARALSADGWRKMMPAVRAAAEDLVGRGYIVVTQRGEIVPAGQPRGPVRLQLRHE